MTGDLAIVYSTKPENLVRAERALRRMNATYRDPAGRTISPDIEKLATMKIHLLKTDYGSLDLLKTIGPDLGYQDLIGKATPFEVEGFEVPVVDLEALIEAKELAGRPKDRIGVLYLRELLERRDAQD